MILLYATLLHCYTATLPSSAYANPAHAPYEKYLNSITTLSGRFNQLNSKGHKAAGTIQISRPGKMRLDYAPPSPLMIVTNFLPNEKTTEMSLVRTEDPDAGYITLVFNNTPLSLKEWSVVDAQGVETRVQLSELKANVPLPAENFHINSPNLIQRIF